MQAVAFWTTAVEHYCIFEKLCKRVSVPKRNKMWAGRAHKVSVCKEKKPNITKRKRIAKTSTFDCLSKKRTHLKMKNKFSGKLTI